MRFSNFRPALYSLALMMFGTSAAFAGDEASPPAYEEPTGARITFGVVAGQTEQSRAIESVIQAIKQKWGAEPEVGKFFRAKNSNSVAAFLTGVNHSKNDMQTVGLLIIAPTTNKTIEAALVTDDAQRFGTDINRLLGILFEKWHPPLLGSVVSAETAGVLSPVPSSGGPGTSAPGAMMGGSGNIMVAPQTMALSQFTLPDSSASALIPTGWQISPTSGKGTIMVDGPNGEDLALGFTLLVGNSNDPRVQRSMAFARGAGRNTVYASTIYYPYGGDMAKAFTDIIGLWRQKKGAAPIQFQVTQRAPLSAPAGWHREFISGYSTSERGLRELNTIFTCGPLGRLGNYMVFLDQASVPAQLAAAERDSMLQVISSFNVNQAVVANQAGQIAGPEIARIHEIGRRAAAQAANAHAMADAHNAAVERHWDNMDRQSKAFSDYLLDQSVIQDNQHGTHTTVWNQTADALVKADPSRYEYVSIPGLRKGPDF